jgi:hypothetical protein
MGNVDRPILNSGSIKYGFKAKKDLVTPDTGKQLVYMGATINNRSGGTLTVGVGAKLPNEIWKAGQLVVSSTPDYVDFTTAAQNTTTNDCTLFGTGAADDGFLIQAKKKFGLVILDVTTAEVGSPVYTYEYWNGAWTTLTTIEVPSAYTAAEHVIAFSAPEDWITNTGTAISTNGLTADYYSIKVVATTSPSTTPLARQIWVAELLEFIEGLTDNSQYNFYPEGDTGTELFGGSAIIPYFSTAHANNAASARYKILG